MESQARVRKRRFPSMSELGRQAWQTSRRFPFTLGSAIAAAAIAHYMVELDSRPGQPIEQFVAILLTFSLGIPLFFAIRVLAGSRGWSHPRQTYVALAGSTILLVYYLTLPSELTYADGYRFALLDLALHLWIAFAAFPGRRASENGFWQYNRLLFLRFVTAILYSGVLFVGLALALGACEALLGLDVADRVYFELFIWIAFVYNTWFFLAGIPDDVLSLRDTSYYPSGLRIFTQYVLIPLVAVYLLILYAYLIKIVVEWQLPEGWVVYPVIGASIAGMLALLLIHPLRGREEFRWISMFARLFYWSLFPLIGLVAVAIWTRIGEYGVTEKRYLVVVATAWLFAIAASFSLRRSTSIRLIPISLCAVTFLSAVGPWGATSVSRRSQLERLRRILVANELMVEGRITTPHPAVPFEAQKEISSIVQYLYDLHGLDMLRPWFQQPRRLSDPLTPRLALESMGLEYRSRWETADWMSFTTAAPNPLPVDGFDYVYDISAGAADSVLIAPPGRGLSLWLKGTRIELRGATDTTVRLVIELDPVLKKMAETRATGRSLASEDARVDAENDGYRLRIYLTALTLRRVAGDSLLVQQMMGRALIDAK